MREIKYCDFANLCHNGNGCEKALTIEVVIEAIRNKKPIGRKDCYTDHPSCFISKPLMAV